MKDQLIVNGFCAGERMIADKMKEEAKAKYQPCSWVNFPRKLLLVKETTKVPESPGEISSSE
jgi:hypothetical protein